MYYVYILWSEKDGKLYYGCTNDLKRRLPEHNNGKVTSTKHRRPLKLIFYVSFINKTDAFAREKWFKTGFGYNHVKKMLEQTLKNFGGKSYPPNFADK